MSISNLSPVLVSFLTILFICLTGCDDTKKPTEDIIPELNDEISIQRKDWHFASEPTELDATSKRGKLVWYNPYYMVPTSEIWDIDIAPGEGATNVLTLDFYPELFDRRVKADYLGEIVDPTNSWGGIMAVLDSSFISPDSICLLRLRLKGMSGILNIDIGQINEDINNNGIFENEDLLDSILHNFSEEEDIGLDLMNDNQERVFYGEFCIDPSGDNWFFDPDLEPEFDYSRINGTEGNIQDPASEGRPDSEDIDKDWIWDYSNRYSTYQIDLSDPGNQYYAIANLYGWKSYLIPLGPLSLQYNKMIRLWISSPDGDTVSVSVAQMKIEKISTY